MNILKTLVPMWSASCSKFLPASFMNKVKVPVTQLPHTPQKQPQNVNEYVLGLKTEHAIIAPQKGVIHIGAHKCEEASFYQDLQIENLLWIDGNDELCQMNPVIINALLADEDDKEVDFIITDNEAMSSSILELKEHLKEHPNCLEAYRVKKKTTRLDTLMKSYNASSFDMLVIDVQGAELLVLKGATETLKHINCIISEVNTKELYTDCVLIEDLDAFLSSHGFIRTFTDMTRHGWGDAVYIRRTVTVNIHSGLGNRLFQLAFLYAIAQQVKAIPVLYNDMIQVCSIHCNDSKKYEPFYNHFKRIKGRPLPHLVQLVQEDSTQPCVYVDYTKQILSYDKPIVLFEGYFQSLKFFVTFEANIRSMFLESLKEIQCPRIDASINSFVHVRGRDHIHMSNDAHRLQGIYIYYKDALSQCSIHCSPQNTIIITDDLPYASSLGIFNNFRFSSGKDELEDLRLMTHCSNTAITTNSTFSWWGAFLANCKRVTMPVPFLKSNMGYKDIYYDGIMKLNACEEAKLIFDSIVSVRINPKELTTNVTFIVIRKGRNAPWITSEDDDILINGAPAHSVTYVTEALHHDIYHDMCIIKGTIADMDATHLDLTLNYCTQKIAVTSKPYQPQVTSYDLVSMTMFKNDVPLIEGWVAHNKLLGVEHFFMYYNSSCDINALPQIEDVTYIQWPYPYHIDNIHYAQLGAMTDAIHMLRGHSKYVLFNDLDEYIMWYPKHVSFKEFIINNHFWVYGVLNNFVLITDPEGPIVEQIHTKRFSQTQEMPYGTRSKNVVDVNKVDAFGIHKPLDHSFHDNVCVIAAPTCQLIHVCNIKGRVHVSLSPQAIAQFQQECKRNAGNQ